LAASRSPVAFGAYIITRRIARGGMAEIYRARTRSASEQPSHWVAIKMMRPSMGHEDLREQLFRREARIAALIKHDNVIPLFSFGQEMERHFIAMEYVRGRDLSHLLKNDIRGRELLPFELGLYVGLEAAAGLGHAHRLRDENGQPLGIVHRDISPGNVMIGYDGQVKVLDFGVARINESSGMRTQTGTLRGKFAYMSPEQTLGEALDARSDVFSLGTVIYELLTGSNCFRADNPIATLDRVQRVRPVPPSRANRLIPPTIDRILARCLAKDKKRRFADCTVLYEALGEYLDKERLLLKRDELARHMSEHFAWEKQEEESELTREEEEVALLEVVDFALVEDGGLDAANVAVSQEEEASESEVAKTRFQAAHDEGDVFESEEAGTADGAPPVERAAVAAQALSKLAAMPVIRAGDASEFEKTVTNQKTAKRFTDDEEIEGKSVELSSLLQQPTPQPAPPPREEPKQDSRSASLGLLLVGRRAPEFPATGMRISPDSPLLRPPKRPSPRDTLPASIALSAVLPSKRTIGRPIVVIGALLVAVLTVATVVATGIESQPKVERDRAQPDAKRTKIEPVKIVVGGKEGTLASVTRESSALPKTEEQSPPPDAQPPAAASSHEDEEEQPAGDAEVDESAGPADHPARRARKRAKRPAIAVAKSAPKEHEKAAHAEIAAVTLKKGPSSSKLTGFLNVGAKPWAEIAIDNKPWPYQTPQAGIELSVGKHTVTLHNGETGVTRSQTVQIQQGQYKTISVDMSKK
jgi:serine/threonine protein kinase